MTLPLPDPKVDLGSWELERTGIQRNFDFFRHRFPLEYSTDNFRQVPQARVYNSANLPIAHNTVTALTFNSERSDLGTATEQHSTSSSTSRLTCRVAGLYDIRVGVEFASNASGLRNVYMLVNGGTRIVDTTQAAVSGASTRMSPTASYRLAVGDYVEAWVYQDSGSSLNVLSTANWSPEFSFHWVSP